MLKNDLHKCSVDLDVQDNDGNTPLHYAVESSAIDALSCLLQCGANCSIVNNEQNGPIHLATQMNKVEILEVNVLHAKVTTTHFIAMCHSIDTLYLYISSLP